MTLEPRQDMNTSRLSQDSLETRHVSRDFIAVMYIVALIGRLNRYMHRQQQLKYRKEFIKMQFSHDRKINNVIPVRGLSSCHH